MQPDDAVLSDTGADEGFICVAQPLNVSRGLLLLLLLLLLLRLLLLLMLCLMRPYHAREMQHTSANGPTGHTSRRIVYRYREPRT